MKKTQMFLTGMVVLLAIDCARTHAQQETIHYVAMGSSFAAGPTIAPVATDPGSAECGRSGSNYAHLLAEQSGLSLTDVSCGGATTANILDHGQSGAAAQLSAVNAQTQLVTVTIGGNDVFYIATVNALACRNRAEANPEKHELRCNIPSSEKVEAAFINLKQRMRDIAKGVKAKAPNAKLIFVDYLQIAPATGTCEGLGLSAKDADRVREMASRIDAITKQAAMEEHVDYLSASSLSLGHDACSQDPWTNGFAPLADGTFTHAPFHPNAKGMQAIANELRKVVEQ